MSTRPMVDAFADLRLVHHSAAPFVLDRERKYVQEPRAKPTGLWLSVVGQDDWASWCTGEEFRLDDLAQTTVVNLVPGANVKMLSTALDLDLLTSEFHFRMGAYDDSHSIDWPSVAAQFDGIIIAPYVWPRRLDLMWYYGWDCASGVIWNLSAIADVAGGLKPKGGA